MRRRALRCGGSPYDRAGHSALLPIAPVVLLIVRPIVRTLIIIAARIVAIVVVRAIITMARIVAVTVIAMARVVGVVVIAPVAASTSDVSDLIAAPAAWCRL
jgi:hypothetical protein